MFEKEIRLNRIEDVKGFVEKAMLCNFDIDLRSGKYTVNGKSIMGIFSLDLTSPLTVAASCDANDPKLLELVEPYLA